MKKLAVVSLVTILLLCCIVITINEPANIDLDSYSVQTGYRTLNQDEQKLFDEILEAAESGQEVVRCEKSLTSWETWEKLSRCFQLYYGTDGYGGFIVPFDGLYVLQLPYFYEARENKVVIDARVDEALLNMREGPDRYKLWQISKYLADRIIYTDGARDAIGGLNGKGVCATYAMLFYKMAVRLGIECYYCYGYAGGGPHAWNMVKLDGKCYFYDVTWFDKIVYDFVYIHSESPWGRDYVYY